MNAREGGAPDGKVVPITDGGPDDELTYVVELWARFDDKPDRTLGRAAVAGVAWAIFNAAKVEYPDGRIVLRQGPRVLAEAG